MAEPVDSFETAVSPGCLTLNELAAEANSIAVDAKRNDDPLALVEEIDFASMPWRIARDIELGVTGSVASGMAALIVECLYVTSLMGIDIGAAVQARLDEARAKQEQAEAES